MVENWFRLEEKDSCRQAGRSSGGGQLQDALCLTLFPCCTTVGAAASSAIMKGHRSAGPSLHPSPLTRHPALPPNNTPQPSANCLCSCCSPPSCHQGDYFNKGNVKGRRGVCVLFCAWLWWWWDVGVLTVRMFKPPVGPRQQRVAPWTAGRVHTVDVLGSSGCTAAVKAHDKTSDTRLIPVEKTELTVANKTETEKKAEQRIKCKVTMKKHTAEKKRTNRETKSIQSKAAASEESIQIITGRLFRFRYLSLRVLTPPNRMEFSLWF